MSRQENGDSKSLFNLGSSFECIRHLCKNQNNKCVFKCFAKLKLDEKDFYSICSISKNLSRQNLGVTDHTFISKVDFSFYLFTTNIFE